MGKSNLVGLDGQPVSTQFNNEASVTRKITGILVAIGTPDGVSYMLIDKSRIVLPDPATKTLGRITSVMATLNPEMFGDIDVTGSVEVEIKVKRIEMSRDDLAIVQMLKGSH